MALPIKMTAQGIRDLNDRGPKKKAVAPVESIPPAATDEQPAVASPPATEDATAAAVAHHG